MNPKKPVGKQHLQRPAAAKTKTPPAAPEKILGNKQAFYILLGLLGALALFVFRDFIFVNKVFLYKDIGSDSINGWYPEFYHFSDYLRNLGGIPQWSFYHGMGQNLLGKFSVDPFVMLMYLAKPDNYIYWVGTIVSLEVIASGVLFYLFLRELKLLPYIAITGAMCFAFSGFIMLGSCWLTSIEVFQIAFLLLSVEKLLNKKWYYYPFAIALIAFTTPFNLFLFCLVAAVYVLVRLYNRHGWSKKMLSVYGLLIGLGVVGVGISAFISLNKLQLMLDSPRVSGNVSFFAQLMSTPLFGTESLGENLTKIGRLFSNDMLGFGSFTGAINYFVGSGNYYEAPAFYIGLPALLLFSQLFPFLSKRQKWVFGITLACAVLPFIFPFFRYALWLFTGNYYRVLSFFFGLLLLMYTLLSLHKISTLHKINYTVLIATFIGLSVLLFYPNMAGVKHPYQPNLPLFRANIQTFCFVFLIIYTVLAALLQKKSTARIAKPLFIGLLFIELAFMANMTINKRDIVSYGELKSKVGYNDYTVDAVQYLHRIDTSFYRIQKTYGSSTAIHHKSILDSYIQKFYGTASYDSFNQKNYVYFLLALNAIPDDDETATRWLEGLLVNRPLLQIFGNVHYNLYNSSHSKNIFPPQMMSFLNDSITKTGDVYIYRNKYTLPFGYTYSQYMPRNAFDTLPFFENLWFNAKDIALLEAVVIDDHLAEKYSSLQKLEQAAKPDHYWFAELAADVDALKEEPFTITHFSQNNIKGTITLSKPKLLFFTIPYDKGWRAFDNGEEISIDMVNVGFSGLLLPAGQHTLELKYTSPLYYTGLFVSIIFVLLVAVLCLLYWKRQTFCSKRNPATRMELSE